MTRRLRGAGRPDQAEPPKFDYSFYHGFRPFEDDVIVSVRQSNDGIGCSLNVLDQVGIQNQ
jgi:hypothetical protein